MMTKIRTYSELMELDTFEERYEYLKLDGYVGKDTFGFDRYLNQDFYRSVEWKSVRNKVIARDNGCDLACSDRPIFEKVLVHHMNPITVDQVTLGDPMILDMEYLITISHDTHNAVHFGSIDNLFIMPEERYPGDTKLW